MKFTGKRPQTKSKPNSRGRLCASLRNRNAHGHLARAILGPFCAEICCLRGRRQAKTGPHFSCEPAQSKCMRRCHSRNLQARGRRPRPAKSKCAWTSMAPDQEQTRTADFVRAFTVQMQMDISQEQL